MTNRRLVFSLLIIFVSIISIFADASVRVRKLGDPKTAFYSPDIRTEDDLKRMLQDRREDMRDILRQVNWRGNVEDLFNALDRGVFSGTTLSSGTHLPWMAARKTGHPKAMLDVLYEGPPVDAYAVDFESAGTGWRFIAPKICSNFWIEERAIEQPAPPPAPAPPPPAPAPPPPEPEIAPPPPPPAPEPEIEVHHQQMLFGAGFIGKERREDFLDNDENISLGSECKTIVGFKGGILPRLKEHLEAELSVGGKFVINDEDTDPNNNNLLDPEEDDDEDDDANKTFFVDAALHAVFNHGFVGGGVSFWDLNSHSKRTVALLFQFGFGPQQVQITFEARAPFEDIGDIENNYMFWGGLRIHP